MPNETTTDPKRAARGYLEISLNKDKNDKIENEKNFKGEFEKILEQMKHTETTDQPSTWLQSLSPQFNHENIENFAPMIEAITSILTEGLDVVETSSKCKGLTLATISTGVKSKVQLLHHVSALGTDFVALFGHNDPHPLVIDPKKLFTKTITKVSDVDGIASGEENDHQATLESVVVPNSIFLTPALAKYVIDNNPNMDSSYIDARDLVRLVIDFCKKEDELREIPSFVKCEETDEDSPKNHGGSVTVNPQSAIVTHRHALTTTKSWDNNSKAKAAGSIPSSDSNVMKWKDNLHETTLQPPNLNNTQEHQLPGSPTKNKNITLSGGRLTNGLMGQNLNDSFTSELNTPQSPRDRNGSSSGPHNPPDENPATPQLQNALQVQLSEMLKSLQTQQESGTNANQSSQLMQMVLVSLLNSSEKQNSTQERLIEVHEAANKLRQENSKNKISDPTTQFLRNIFTTDGVNPLDKIPEGIKELMTTNTSVTLQTLNLCLASAKAPAKPTTSIVKALNSGAYTYDTGKPTNLNPMCLPLTTKGSGQENLNLQQLLADYENGDDLSRDEKDVLTSKTIHPPRSINYAIKMLKSYVAVIGRGGTDSILYQAVSGFLEWVEENEQHLSEITNVFDRDLPAKLTYVVGDFVNNYMKSGMTQVPSPSWLNFNEFQKALREARTNHVTLPPSVTEALRPKRKNGPQPTGPFDEGHDQKRRFVVIEHEDQPIQLKCNKNMQRKVISSVVKNINNFPGLVIPKNNGEDECLLYAFEGECNSKCKRKNNHKPVKTNTARYNALLKFRKEAIDIYNKENPNNTENFS